MKYHLYSLNTQQVFCLDVTKSYSEDHKANVTKHPVEEGAPISDHIYLDNPSLSVKGVISDYDSGYAQIIDLSSFESTSIFGEISNIIGDIWGGDSNITSDALSDGTTPKPVNFRSIEFAKALKMAMYDKHIFSLMIIDETTDEVLDHFNTVAIEGLRFGRDTEGGSDLLQVDLQLTQVRTAKIKRTEVSNAEKSALDKSVDKQAKANATKNSSSGTTGKTKDGKKTKDSKKGGASSSDSNPLGAANKAFGEGASSGSKAGSDRVGDWTKAVTAKGSEIRVQHKDMEKAADNASKRARQGGN